MSTNNRISNLVSSQVPFFVRNDHQVFIRFLESYYEYLEQNNKAVEVSKNIRFYQDIDRTLEQYADKLYSEYMKLMPADMQADKALVMKYINDFYVARGTEKSIKFLFRVLFNVEDVEFYYPKKDVLRASDGKWYIQRTLRVETPAVDGEANNTLNALINFVNRPIYGANSGATAVGERIDQFYDSGTFVSEVSLSSIVGSFENGEQIYTRFEGVPIISGANTIIPIHILTANVFGGVVNTIRVTNPGAGYNVGDPAIIESNVGVGATAVVSKVGTGNVTSITVLEGGAGYRAQDYVLITGGGGSGANGELSLVRYDGSVHPNTYNIYIDFIYAEQNTAIGNAKYSNLNSSITDPANNWIANSLSAFVYANTGPAQIIQMNDAGAGYTSLPSISIQSNTRIRELGLLGRVKINDGGSGYNVGDVIEFINYIGCYGTGAAANVRTVNATGAITNVQFQQVPGHPMGGTGYDLNYLPIANVISATGTGANVEVSALLGTGGTFIVSNTTLGAIEKITVTNRGSGYTNIPTINLTQHGDGTATANATIIDGVFEYPGRWLNDDGHLSSYNFLQDRDYYQSYSYVVRVGVSLNSYRKAMKDLIHPAGMKMFGEYMVVDNNEETNGNISIETNQVATETTGSYGANGNVMIRLVSHGLSVGNTVRLKFVSGNIANYAYAHTKYTPNSLYKVSNVVNSDYFLINSGTWLSGRGNVTNTIVGYEAALVDLYVRDDGKKVYGLGSTFDRINEFDMSRAYDITTATYKRSNTVSLGLDALRGLEISPDGKNVYVNDITLDVIYQYEMTEAWNIQSLAVTANTFNVNSSIGLTAVQSIRAKPDGKTFYVIEGSAGSSGKTATIFQLSLSEPWNISTATLETYQSIAGVESAPFGIHMKYDGSVVYCTGSGSSRVSAIPLKTSWNVNTANMLAVSNSFSMVGFDNNPSGVYLANTGNLVYISGNQYDVIYQFRLLDSWNVNTAFYMTNTTGNVRVSKVI